MTLHQLILDFLAGGTPIYKNAILDYMRLEYRQGGDSIAVRLRELVRNKQIIKLTDENGVTMYKLAPSTARSEQSMKQPRTGDQIMLVTAVRGNNAYLV
jgi:hypothetical protein